MFYFFNKELETVKIIFCLFLNQLIVSFGANMNIGVNKLYISWVMSRDTARREAGIKPDIYINCCKENKSFDLILD